MRAWLLTIIYSDEHNPRSKHVAVTYDSKVAAAWEVLTKPRSWTFFAAVEMNVWNTLPDETVDQYTGRYPYSFYGSDVIAKDKQN